MGEITPEAQGFKMPKSAAKLSRRRTSNMVSTWMRSDRQSAMAWIEGQEDPKVRDQLIPNMVSAWSNEDPAGAAAYAN